MTFRTGVVAALVALMGVAAGVDGSAASPTVAVVAQAEAGGVNAIAGAPQGSGLPFGPPPPRTMEAQWPVFVAFTLVWLAVVGYVLSFNGRLKRVAERLAAARASRGGADQGGGR